MTKVLVFIFALALAQSFPIAAISGETSATGNAIVDGSDNGQGPKMGPPTVTNAVELEIAKEAYFGKPGTGCGRLPGTECYEKGACCEGRGKCKLLYRKITSMSSAALVNFCLDGQ